jgi:hypothetical protein
VKVETRGVLAGAYLGKSGALRGQTARSHSVEIGEDGWEVRVLCGKVKVDNMVDAGAGGTGDPPTCATCLRRDPRFRVWVSK